MNPNDLRWRWCRLTELSALELQRIHMARQQVFVVEQHCVFQDADAYDETSFHLAAWAPALELLAYARVVDPGLKYDEPSMGRVITTEAARGSGLGRELVRRVLHHAALSFPGQGMRISAQSRLEKFYQAAGFEIVGERYLEDEIAHTEMVLKRRC